MKLLIKYPSIAIHALLVIFIRSIKNLIPILLTLLKGILTVPVFLFKIIIDIFIDNVNIFLSIFNNLELYTINLENKVDIENEKLNIEELDEPVDRPFYLLFSTIWLWLIGILKPFIFIISFLILYLYTFIKFTLQFTFLIFTHQKTIANVYSKDISTKTEIIFQFILLIFTPIFFMVIIVIINEFINNYHLLYIIDIILLISLICIIIIVSRVIYLEYIKNEIDSKIDNKLNRAFFFFYEYKDTEESIVAIVFVLSIFVSIIYFIIINSTDISNQTVLLTESFSKYISIGINLINTLFDNVY